MSNGNQISGAFSPQRSHTPACANFFFFLTSLRRQNENKVTKGRSATCCKSPQRPASIAAEPGPVKRDDDDGVAGRDVRLLRLPRVGSE